MPKVKDKEKILQAVREKQSVTYKGVPSRMSVDFSKKSLPAVKNWQEVLKVKKSEDLHPRLLYSAAQLSFRIEGQIKCFSDKVQIKEFIMTKPLLYEMVKGLLI